MANRSDKARINWLEDPDHYSFQFEPQMSGGVFVFGHWAERLGAQRYKGEYFKSLRKAIDAAMDAEAADDRERSRKCR
jgi:hypothetical protein